MRVRTCGAQPRPVLVRMIFLFERMKVVVEPSGAVALAAAVAAKVEVRGLRVGVIVSGGNIGFTRFCDLVGRRSEG